MEIALVTEGTYPFHMGGVAVWCDQLMRGLPELGFKVCAIGSTEAERISWPAPSNLNGLETMFLWGEAPSRPQLRTEINANDPFALTLDRLVRSLVRPEGATQEFLEVLRELFTYAQSNDLEAALLSNTMVQRFLSVWLESRRARRHSFLTARDADATPNLSDALTVLDLLSHLLRPLSYPPPKANLTHAVSNGLAALVGITAKWVHGTPFLLTEHGVYLRERYLSYTAAHYSYPVRVMALNFYRLLSSAAYVMADLITPGSQYNRRWEERGGASSDKIRPVYNGINPLEFPPAPTDPVQPTLTWFGRIDPLKDVHTLLRAFAIVHAEMPQARLRIFGPTPQGNEAYFQGCVDLMHDLGLEGIVRFEGRVDSPLEAYHAGQVYVMTSISEGFPYTLIEAMATGRAVVATDVGGVAEAIGEAGLLVPPRDHDAVAQACLRLLRSADTRRNLGAAARSRVLSQFSLEKFLTTYRRVYAEVARAGSKKPEPNAKATLGRAPKPPLAPIRR